MDRRQVGFHDRRQALLRWGLLGHLAPALGGAIHRIVEGLDHQRLAGIEMGVEAAMGQAGLLHQVGDADAMRALFAKPHRGLLHDPRVGFLLVLFRITHQGIPLNVCSHIIAVAGTKSCIYFAFSPPIIVNVAVACTARLPAPSRTKPSV